MTRRLAFGSSKNRIGEVVEFDSRPMRSPQYRDGDFGSLPAVQTPGVQALPLRDVLDAKELHWTHSISPVTVFTFVEAFRFRHVLRLPIGSMPPSNTNLRFQRKGAESDEIERIIP